MPEGNLNNSINSRITELYQATGVKIENGSLKEAIDMVFEFVRFCNKYFDTKKPWETRNSNVEACGNTLYNCIQFIANLAVLLEPFLPFSSLNVRGWLGIDGSWTVKKISSGFILPEAELLFERIDKNVINEEVEKLNRNM